MIKGGSRRTKVLFFAWGDSIHARRRIQIFTEDSTFEVGVISTFPYEFENAKNYYLSFSCPEREGTTGSILLRKIFSKVLSRLMYLAVRYFDDEITTVDCDCYRWIMDLHLVKNYARKFKPDVIFLQTLMYPCYLSFFLPRKIPTVITFWNGDLTWWAKWNGIERAMKKQIVLHGIKRAQAITVNSDAAFDACLGYGAARNKVKLIRYPGVNLDLFKPHPDKIAARKRLGLLHGKIVLCPRGLGDYLNSDVIVESAAIVAKKFPDVQFLFLSGVGEGELWDRHKKRAADLGISENIRRDGHISWENMPTYYNASDVVVSVSSNDSLPNCMMEAMACGVPLVMGDIPQIRTWIKDGDNGYLVPPRDAALLAEAIMKIFDKKSTVEKFTKRNMDLVHREFDGRFAASAVKSLVRNIAAQGE